MQVVLKYIHYDHLEYQVILGVVNLASQRVCFSSHEEIFLIKSDWLKQKKVT